MDKIFLWPGLAFVLIIAVSVSMCSSPSTDNGGNRQDVNVTVNVGAQVLDLVNDTPVPGSTVYFVACSPGKASLRDVHLSGLTGADGWALFSVNYTLDKDQTIYLGASNWKPLVESDFAGMAFNGTGYLGEWKSFNYSMLFNSEDHQATVSCTITVDQDTGKMI